MIHLFALLSLLLCGVCYTGFQNSSHFRNTGSRRSLLLLVFGGALLLRLLLAYTTHGFSNDIACFAAWADRIFTLGPGQFYSAEMFTDYPPGFMYVLYLIGALLGTGGFRIHADDHPYVPVPHEGKPASCLCCLRTGCPVKATDADLHAGTAGRDLGPCVLTGFFLAEILL